VVWKPTFGKTFASSCTGLLCDRLANGYRLNWISLEWDIRRWLKLSQSTIGWRLAETLRFRSNRTGLVTMSRNVDAELARRSRVLPASRGLDSSFFFAELIFLRRHNVFQLGLHLEPQKG